LDFYEKKYYSFTVSNHSKYCIAHSKEYSCENRKPVNQPPVANAGRDTTIKLPTDSIMLDGKASTDPGGTITSYKWAKIQALFHQTL
jgi:hypothetical protein